MNDTQARRLLELERDRLTAVRAAAGGAGTASAEPEAGSVDQRPWDAATELAERETQMAAAELASKELHEVQIAFERVDAGTYGVCEACDKVIPDARLEAKPAARFCVEDQARVDRVNHGWVAPTS